MPIGYNTELAEVLAKCLPTPACRQAGLEGDDFRTTDWVTKIEFPEITLQQTQYLLAI